MWAIALTGAGAPARLGFFNNNPATPSQKFTTLSFTLAGGANANALAGDPTTGILYYFDKTAGVNNVSSVNLNTQVTATVGTITPAAPGGNTNIIGAFVDAAGNLIYLSGGGTYQVAAVSKTGNTTNAVWRTVTHVASGTPVTSASGDVYIDQGGQAWLLSSTTPKAAFPLTLAITAGSPNGTITSATAGTTRTFAATGAIAGGSVDPVTGINYYAGNTSAQIAYSFNPTTSNSEVLVDNTNAAIYTITDMGNCPTAPAKPTISKSFNPVYMPGGIGNTTSTLTLSIGNINTAPVWLMSTFSDVFPAGMVVGPIPSLSTTCTGVPAPVATAGSNNLTWAAGGRIPAGGCSITFAVSATASITPYVNTIPAGSLTTTAGTNTLATQATLTVGTDFSMSKLVRNDISVPATGSTSVGIQQTYQYVLTISNSVSGGTGSATFTDNLPSRATPLLVVSAIHSGGGSCNVATTTATITPATVFGTLTNALAGSTCVVTITVQGSTTAATFVNTATVAPIASTADVVATNNSSTATVTLTPIANITISKTNGLAGTVAAGQIVVYTVTVANLGPSPAVPSFLLDPGGVPGLSCTNVTCAATGTGATCPAAGSTTIAYLQGSAGSGLGIQINTFSAAQTLTFAVTCGVTATGLP